MNTDRDRKDEEKKGVKRSRAVLRCHNLIQWKLGKANRNRKKENKTNLLSLNHRSGHQFQIRDRRLHGGTWRTTHCRLCMNCYGPQPTPPPPPFHKRPLTSRFRNNHWLNIFRSPKFIWAPSHVLYTFLLIV
jgi:hypothetical protein